MGRLTLSSSPARAGGAVGFTCLSEQRLAQGLLVCEFSGLSRATCGMANLEFSDSGDKQIPLRLSLTFCKKWSNERLNGFLKPSWMLNMCNEKIQDLQSEDEGDSLRCVNLLELLSYCCSVFHLENGKNRNSTWSSYFQDCCDNNVR